MAVQDETTEGISIGALSRATGVTIDSLRMWERRYGAPLPIRRPSGHRRYPRTEIERLQKVVRALSSGYRPSEVVAADDVSLDQILSILERGGIRVGVGHSEELDDAGESLDRWLESARSLDEASLSRGFFEEWSLLGPLRFVLRRAVPFLKRLGDEWAASRIGIAEEHFASERLSDFLGGHWRRINERAPGRSFVLTTLPDELHRMGIQMVATILATLDQKVIYLGPETPVSEIVEIACRCHVEAVCISVSGAYDRNLAEERLAQLRSALPDDLTLIVGGAGAPAAQRGILRFADLWGFHDWVRRRVG